MSDPSLPQNASSASATRLEAATARVLAPPLDPSMYKLDEDEAAFFKQQAGINSDEELKQHILRVQAEAYEVYPYPCIRRFGFKELKMSRLPMYDELLKLGKERDAILLDVGCCVGNDVRKVIADGYPLKNVIASDIEPAFWQLGHSLFKDTPESFPVPFVGGDALDPAFLQPTPPIYVPLTAPLPALSEITTLTALQGRISAIHASSLFHLFDEEKQLTLAHSLAGLLAPHPGAMIFGSHVGAPEKGSQVVFAPAPGSGGKEITMFCHSLQSWRELWVSIFGADKVKVNVELKEIIPASNPDPQRRWFFLEWSVRRV
ncbi:hypothetical protein DAEQUDRAFT_764289 [Daedalea quercina L-15889]|uniref:Methyltransferase domain-containing protein n=1 Tax=Daedalea quercina L-15889 TaxID=1314783 RepID=A0A165RG49_9APHY|nr:hypothetical protein DAEQUDRAFT_764289 [Daedalea quercina L-15889]